MPVRHHLVAIALFWIGTTTWLFYRDLWPRLWPGELPQVPFRLADETRPELVFWEVYCNNVDQGYAKTWVKYRDRDDTFALNCEFKFWFQERSVGGRPDLTAHIMYRVTRESELREIRADLRLRDSPVRAAVQGPVHNGQFFPHVLIKVPKVPFFDIKDVDKDLEPVPVSRRGYVLDPMEPMDRMPSLRPGQHWRIPLSSPLGDAVLGVGKQLLAELLGGFAPGMGSDFPWLDANVLPDPEILNWPRQTRDLQPEYLAGFACSPFGGFPGSFSWAGLYYSSPQPLKQPMVSCLVIAYRGEGSGGGITGRTWIRQSDGQVLRQEVNTRGLHLLLERVGRKQARHVSVLQETGSAK